jgi:acetyl esterase/lipase
MAEQLELDNRMSDETKNYINTTFKFMRPNNIPKSDVKVVRAQGDINNDRLNNTINLENISVETFFIENKTDGYQIPVQTLAPKTNDPSKSNSPVTIFFHGGGWTLGSLKSHFYTLVKLAKSTNSVWISIDYRLAPEYKFETQLKDVRSAVEWVLKNKTKYSLATAKVGTSGDSAGG